ncbi:MAG: PEP/pyruvate-binding domain-containing protein, partial [Myxococcota bacterium]|nr:PEP/pyruvate-binding domain-containing protein [Myxococcota bacterium]
MDVILHTQHQQAKQLNLGGKAAGLFHLESLHAKVPPFFVISSEAFRQHLPEREWGEFLLEQAHLNPETPNQPLPKAQALCEAIRKKTIQASLREEIEQAFQIVPATHYAIRSSMIGEDSIEHSFAGQLESFLFQSDLEAVIQSIQNCWCSAFQNRVLLYRKRAGLIPEDIRVAVVVQKMVKSEVSGVLFTVDPQSGHRSHIWVSAAWGQGEGVVSGACNCDEFIWHKREGELHHTVADKDIMFVSDPKSHTGTREEETPPEKRHIRSLPTEHLHKLCTRAAQLETSFAYPLDIEWALEGEEIFFLQARPITALPEAPNEDGPVVVWDNSNIQESYCGVTTPLTFSYAQRAYHTVYRQTMEALSIPQETIDESHRWLKNLLGIIRGRIYYNINNWYRGLSYFPSFGKNKADMEEMMGLKDPVDFIEDQQLDLVQKIAKLPRMAITLGRLLWAFRQLRHTVPAFQDRFETICSALSLEKIRTMHFSQLMELNEQLRLDVQEKWHVPIINDFYVMMSTGGLRRFLTQNGLSNALQLQNHLLAGEPGIESTEPTKILVGLADTLRLDDAFMKEIPDLDDEAFYKRLQNHSPETQKILSHYIQRYGDRVMGELKLETETLRENPNFLVQILRNYLQN